MPRSDLVVKLIKAGVSGDGAELRSVAESIAADERAKKHGGVAERIARVLDSSPTNSANGKSNHQGVRVRDGSGGIQRKEPRIPLSNLYLSRPIRSACEELIEEQGRADVLRSNGLEPRHRVLMVGPPGNGKTSLAEALAYELALPLFTVRYDAVVTSYLGETAQRLRRLFDFVRTEPCVLFFDEFDAIGKERGDLHETGEIKRVVTTLLLQLDDLPSYCVFVGATNHPELLDRATWRRFELRINVAKPTELQMTTYFADQLRKLTGTPGYTAKRLLEDVSVNSYSEAENFFLDVRRRVALSMGEISLRSVISERVRAWNERIKIPGESENHDRTTHSSAS